MKLKILSYLQRNKVISFIIMAILIVVAGLLRDRIFYYVNARIKYLEGFTSYGVFEGTLPEWMEELDRGELIWLKWGLTLMYIIIFYAICHLGVVLLVNNPKPMILALNYLYIVGTTGALCLFGIDYVVDFNDIGFKSSRFIMQLLQSPLPLFMLYPAQFLMKK